MRESVLLVLLLCVAYVAPIAAYPADDSVATGEPQDPAPKSDAEPDRGPPSPSAPPGLGSGLGPGRPGAASGGSRGEARARRQRKLRKISTPSDVLEGAESGAVLIGRASSPTTTSTSASPSTPTPGGSTSNATTSATTSATSTASPITTTASGTIDSTTTLTPPTTASPAPPDVTTSSPSTSASPTTLRNTASTTTASVPTAPYRGRGKYRPLATSTEVPEVPETPEVHEVEHLRPLLRGSHDEEQLAPFYEFGRKITSDPTPASAGSPGTNLIAESTTWGRSVLRRVSPSAVPSAVPSAGPADAKKKETQEEENNDEMDVGFDRQVVEKNKLATRRRDSRTMENLVILGGAGASTPPSGKKAARRKFVVTRKILLNSGNDSTNVNVTHLERVGAVSTVLPTTTARPTPRPTESEAVVEEVPEDKPDASQTPRRSLEMSSSAEAMRQRASSHRASPHRASQLDVHRIVSARKEQRQQYSAQIKQEDEPSGPSGPSSQDVPKDVPQDVPQNVPQNVPQDVPKDTLKDEPYGAYVVRRFEDPSVVPSPSGFIKPPKSQIPYSFIVGARSASADDVEVLEPGPRLGHARGAVVDAAPRPEVVEAVVTSVSVKQLGAGTTQDPMPSEEQVSTENLQDVIKIFFNNTAPPTLPPAVTELPPPPPLPRSEPLPLSFEVVRNTSEVSVVLPTAPSSSAPPATTFAPTTSNAPPASLRFTTTSTVSTPTAPPSTVSTSTAPPSTASPSTAQPSTASPSTAAPSTASPSTAPPSTASPTPFIIHVLPSENPAKPRAIWRDTTTTSTSTSTTEATQPSSTSTTTTTTTPSTTTSTTTTTTTTTPSTTTSTTTTTTTTTPSTTTSTTTTSTTPASPPSPEGEVAPSPPHAPSRSNPPVPISAETIRQRSLKQRPIPVPKEVFKTMTTVAPAPALPSAPPAPGDSEAAETTVTPTTSTSTPKPDFQQPRPSITPVRKEQLGRGGGRDNPADSSDLLGAKGRGRAVSKQDFALMEGQDAKRVPTEQGVVPPGVGVLTYVLLALGVVPLALAGVCTARYFINRRKKVLDESDSSSELSCHRRTRLTRPDVSPTAKLPRPLPHLPTPPTPPKAWDDGELEHCEQRERDREREREWERDRVLQMPAPTRWEFPRDKLRLQTLLGQGNFGQVWKAEADDISGHHGLTRLVAVKTVKEGASVREREDLLRELGIMQQLGAHPNVVTLLGCCTEKEPFLLIMEYVMYGKLLAFLRDHRTRQDYYNFSEDSDALTSRDLTVFAFCVSRGMEYLASKGVIHRDLAARNVLVDHNKLCKIADFGMSRSVRDSGCGQVYEQRETKGALPIRWMAPESLIYSVFTHKSDVWSFGILMWEIVTLGSTPYPTMGAREVLRRVRDGYRLERPAHCRPELFRIVLRCWNADASKRPDFAELRRALAELLEDGVRAGSYVDLEGFAMDSNKAGSGGGGSNPLGSNPSVLLNPLGNPQGNSLRDEANV